MPECKHTEPAMKYYIMKDGENIAITFTKKNALDLIRSYQQYEDHYLLKAQFSILRGEPEVFVSYPAVKGCRAPKSGQPKTDTVRRKYTMRICGVVRHYSYEELRELFSECREPFGLATDPTSFESWLHSQIESGRVIQSGADETTNPPPPDDGPRHGPKPLPNRAVAGAKLPNTFTGGTIMEFRIDYEKLIHQVRQELEACDSFASNIKIAMQAIAEQPFERYPESLCEQIRYNQQMGRVYLERAVAALELAGVFNEESGDCADIKTVRERLRALENAVKLANQTPAVEKYFTTEIAIRVYRGLVTEVYSSDPRTDVTVIDEDVDEEEREPQDELPPYKVYD